MTVRLTSHFAGNKVTLFDFQLAEHMNQQYKITGRWFVQYPWTSPQAIATWKIVIFTVIVGGLLWNIGAHWGNFYPSSSQRGGAPQAAQYRRLLVAPYAFESGALRSEKDAELYSKAFVDDYAFKRTLFRSRSAI